MRRVLPVLVLVAVMAALLFRSQRRTGPLVVSGFLEVDEVRVGSRVGGRVARVAVEEGQRVAPGEVLVELEPYDLAEQEAGARAELAVQQAELARLEAGYRATEVAGAEARVAQLAAALERLENGPRAQELEAGRADLRLAEAELELARSEHARAARLEADAVTSKNALDRAGADLRGAEAKVDARRAALGLLEEGTRAEDLAQARAALAEAQAAHDELAQGYRSGTSPPRAPRPRPRRRASTRSSVAAPSSR
ncbi:MAG: biotin/lipoyl-binding protein [Planctomycetes bacterium]|nr:biotin/lipoyl-binding protein [Planctomycetota bacterium]